MTWLALFALLMNYSFILAYHQITRLFSTNSATMLMPSDVIYSCHHHALSHIEKLTAIYCTHFLICVPSSFVGKIYTYHRSKDSPGVRFCKYLLVHLLTGRHVCFSYFTFTFCPLPVSIKKNCGLCAYLGCLIGLNLKMTDAKQAIERKKLPFKQAYNPPPPHPPTHPPTNVWGHISTLD